MIYVQLYKGASALYMLDIYITWTLNETVIKRNQDKLHNISDTYTKQWEYKTRLQYCK